MSYNVITTAQSYKICNMHNKVLQTLVSTPTFPCVITMLVHSIIGMLKYLSRYLCHLLQCSESTPSAPQKGPRWGGKHFGYNPYIIWKIL